MERSDLSRQMQWIGGPPELLHGFSMLSTNGASVSNRRLRWIGKDNPASDQLLQSLLTCTDLMDNFVCIRLEAASVEAAQLNVYYPVLVIPLIYLINHEGCALVSICGPATAEEVRQKLNEGLSPSVDDIGDTSTSASVANTCTKQDSAAGESAAAIKPVSERAELARQKLEEIRQRKFEEEKEKEKEKEKERRSVGRQMTKLREQQREQEQKEMKEELRRKRLEEKEARERVKRQIEEDRRERNARLSAANPAPVIKEPSTANTAVDGASASTASMSSQITRLQFRLPDGTNIVSSFTSSDHLSVAYDYLKEATGGRFGDLAMSSLYPRRRFGPDDMKVSLTELGLSPSSAIAVRAGSNQNRAEQASSGKSTIDAILSPIMTLWAIVIGMLTSLFSIFSRPAVAASNNSNDSANPNSQSTSGFGQNRPDGEVEGARRRRGNITRLGDLSGDDDDNNTWNGNSTQQM